MKFAKERTQPSLDLISRLADISPSSVIDLGCGPGNSTAALKARFGNASILGVDASDNMLEKASKSYPDIQFKKCLLPEGLDDIDGKFDLIFSNACIQWIPEQKKLLTVMADKLTQNGVIAVQCPYIQAAPFYKVLYKLIEEKYTKLSRVNNFHNLLPDEYYDLLCELGLEPTIWHTVYYHVVPSHEGIIDWYRGSGLRPYLDVLDSCEKEELEAQLLEEIRRAYPVNKNSRVILKMPRIFFIAHK